MIFDVVIVITVLVSSAFGAWKGLAWQAAGVLSLVLGFAVALPLSGPLAFMFGASAPLNRFIAVAVLYALVSLGVYVAALCYRTTIQKWKLEHWDRHLGAVAGAIKGFLLGLVLTYFAVTLSANLREPILRTRAGRVMAHTMSILHPIWPPGVHDIIHPYVHRLEEPMETAPKNPPPPQPK